MRGYARWRWLVLEASRRFRGKEGAWNESSARLLPLRTEPAPATDDLATLAAVIAVWERNRPEWHRDALCRGQGHRCRAVVRIMGDSAQLVFQPSGCILVGRDNDLGLSLAFCAASAAGRGEVL
ncbi:MAG: hypothetical protein HKN03_02215 [Acidimicrobiales bacterium]|nr:hypothetical protein [Acidimicrobiales bacterium]